MVRTSRRSPAVVAVLAVIAMLLMALSPSASAAPYTADATIAVSTTNPAVGGTLTISLSGFAPNENVAVDLHSTLLRLVSVQVDASGSAVVTVQLPSDFRCAHFITGTGLTSGRVARVDIFIGPASGCPGNGNGGPGSGSGSGNNSGFGNSGNNNSGFGNSGNNNSGFNNRGDNNSGFNNTGNGNSGFGNGGNPGFANTASATDVSSGGSGASAGAAWFILLGLAVVGGAGFLRQRRTSA